jgi:hypothetical protein
MLATNQAAGVNGSLIIVGRGFIIFITLSGFLSDG